MPSAKLRKKILLSGVALTSQGEFSVANSIEATLLAKAYGVILICQIGFLFLSRIRFRNHESTKTTKD
jgi:uncharacterized membrane protein SirB2